MWSGNLVRNWLIWKAIPLRRGGGEGEGNCGGKDGGVRGKGEGGGGEEGVGEREEEGEGA